MIRIGLLLIGWCCTPTVSAQPVTKVAAGWYHSLLLKSDGSLSTMGWNFNGQLGDGSSNNTNRPKRVVSSGVTAVAGGLYHTIFLKADGSLWGVGNNGFGQLGDGTYDQTYLPEELVASNITAIAAGSEHSLFIKTDGSLWGMGWNYDGELGRGIFSTNAQYGFNTPQMIVASNATAVAAGQFFSLFLKSDGSLWAMGDNLYGQLGDGSYNPTNLPEQIVTNGVVAIAAGDNHSLFLKCDGSVWAMGNNSYGQLGDGTYASSAPYGTNQPQQIAISNVTAIAAGNTHSLFLKSDGSLSGTGNNGFGQLSDCVSGGTNQPVPIIASGVTAMFAGHYNTMFLKSDGSLWAMGYNGLGQLGDGTLNNTNRPELILGAYNQIVSQFSRIDGMHLSYIGIPGTNYVLERSFDLAPANWAPILTNPADSGGTLTFTNQPEPASNNFWRIRSMP